MGRRSSIAGLCLLLLALLMASCSKGEESSPDRPGQLKLKVDGNEVSLPLKTFDIFLVEEEDKYAETFSLDGPDVHLVGTFPMSIHVGYGEHYDVLKDKLVSISEEGGEPGRESSSSITLPAGKKAVTGGSLYFDKADPNRVKGTITIEVDSGTLEGSFDVPTTTWG